VVIVVAGEFIPGDGDVIEGIASVDESAITGESAPVIRESGGDRSAVTGGTRVLSDRIVIRITSNPGETFIDRMIALVEGAQRQKTPNELALNILLAALTIIFMLAVVTLQPMAFYSNAPQSLVILVALLVALIPTTIGALLSAIGIAAPGPVRGWIRQSGGTPAPELGAMVDAISSAGGTPLVVGERSNGTARALGVIHLKDIVKEGISERFDEMRKMGIRTVMITGDNPLTAKAIADESGVDDFLAKATPEDKMALIKQEQEGGQGQP